MKARAFTLPELLTVIAILAVLASLILASLSSAKSQATSTACRNNLGQIAKAMAVYTADFGKYPGTRWTPQSWPPKPGGPYSWGQMWDRMLLPYTEGNASIFRCPSDPSPHIMAYFLLTNYSYGYNACGTGRAFPELNLGLGHPKSPENELSSPIWEVAEAQVTAPSDMVAVGDLNDLQNLFDPTIWPGAPSPYYPSGPAARHAGGANMVFCDDHTEFAKQKNWVEETDTARRRWNNDHQPHPETW
jgi:prepilin-type N-terminal cleavage/methylation domain-containing protein/prepilin-type processing-associated H-X9-DG protein